MKSFEVFERRVNFGDTDLAGIVHFTNILRYVEEAEHAAMFSVGVAPISKKGGFPKVHIDCDYRSPLRFGDVAEVRVEIVKVGGKSLSWEFSVTVAGKTVAEGSLVTAYMNNKGEGAAIPKEIKELLVIPN
ncbi:acyl-CoA thioesterase [Rubritalea sp.]|uniref:acyl-CoA thioesterase n=1 Tax=Rubritalea sp. TaxID=2109375 RepID=UPI003EF9098F